MLILPGRLGLLLLSVRLLPPFVMLVGQSRGEGWKVVGAGPVSSLFDLVVKVCVDIDLAWLIHWMLWRCIFFAVSQLPPVDCEKEVEECGLLAFSHHPRWLRPDSLLGAQQAMVLHYAFWSNWML